MYAIVSHGHPTHFRLRLPRAEVLVGVLAAVVVLDLALVYLDQPGEPLAPAVTHITSVSWVSNGTTLSSAAGFVSHPGTRIAFVLEDTNCLIGCLQLNFTSVSVSPSGFTLVNATLPVIDPGLTDNLTAVVAMPNHSYSGPLTLTLS